MRKMMLLLILGFSALKCGFAKSLDRENYMKSGLTRDEDETDNTQY